MAAEANVKAGAFLGFKVGLQSEVDRLLSLGSSANAQHGCFYLTKDSHRLYVGNEDTSLSPVNEGIVTITWSELQSKASSMAGSSEEAVAQRKAETGRFYYVSDADKNILCVYNGQAFVQLNENTNTYTQSFAATAAVANNTATVTHTLIDNNGGKLPASFSVTGANGITITGTGTALTFTGDTYTLSSEAAATAGTGAKIKLDSTQTTNDSEVEFVAGANVTISGGGASAISIAAKDTTNASLAIKALGASDTPAVGFEVKVTDSEGGTVQNTVDPTISWYTSSDPTATTTNSAHFASGNAVIDTYSRAAIDSKLQAVNAMTYRGTVGTSGTAAKSITKTNGTVSIVDASDEPVPVSIGDTFLTLAAGNYGGQPYQAGSLLIARSTDGSEVDGVIPANKLDFDVVAEQWNTDTTYTLTPITGGVQLVSSTGGNAGSLVIADGDNWIGVAEATSGTAPDQTKTITLTHENVTRTDTTANTQPTQDAKSTLTIPVITGVTSDAKGHLTGITTTNYVVTDTNGTLTSMNSSTSVDANNTTGTITVGATFTQADGNTTGNTPSTSFTVSSSSLQITDADASGGAQGIAVNMVWGSF